MGTAPGRLRDKCGDVLYLATSCAPVLFAAGCVGPHTTLQTAETVEPKHVQVIAGGSVPVHGTFSRALLSNVSNAARRAATDPDAPLTDAEKGAAIEGALAAVLLQPTFVPELSVRVGVLDRVDLGLRYGGATWKLDAKYRFLRMEKLDAALTVGYVRHTSFGAQLATSVFTLFDVLRLVDYSRDDLDAAAIVSATPGGVITPYGALRYIFGRARLDVAFPTQVLGDDDPLRSAPRSSLHYFLGSGGLRIGTRRFAALLELSAGWVAFQPRVFGVERDLSGFVVTPAAGLDVTF